ncbi:5'/3'-nucleotidase SurE [Puia sp.]|jgi:5'-nucleotidase|uniref:5'/3'-nucleotidase SurE n=1 Tax=Puia sp. TaxID=2045100 RepID=UPI002F4155A1
MEKKNTNDKTAASGKARKADGKTAAAKKPGKTGATGFIKTTDTTTRSRRTGKTGPTGIIRETGKNGMGEEATAAEKALEASGKNGKNGKRLPVILVTNDDGINAPGIRNLVEAVRGLGKVVVVAPDKPQSGMGHAITIGNPLRLQPMHHLFEGVEAWSCSGTPVDCVKLAVDKVLRRKPDLCLSGINHGANHSINVIYSGTMSAAVEAAIESIPSMGFSLLDYSVEADFGPARKYVRIIVEQVLSRPMDKHLILNVNFPAVPDNLIKGIKICRQAYAKYEEDFVERNDPNSRKYYWLTGKFVNFDRGRDTDVWALEHNYVSVVPVQFDMTNYVLKSKLEKTWKL